jgi:polyisoprenoid-binding protein YceI
MKQTLLFFVLGAALFASCQSDPKADNAQTGEAQQVSAPAGGTSYKADLAQSRIEWIGTKPIGQHHGSMMLKDGNLTVDNNSVTGGSFTIDMTTLKVLDKDTTGIAKLGGHLSSADFFDVAQYPTASFQLTSVTPGTDSVGGKELVMKDATHTVTGNLTLKAVTKSVTFPAKIAVNDNMATADANFNIDRTQWGLVYGNDQSLGDKFIRPTVNIQLHLVANK